MNRIEFDSLSIDKQINYINDRLSKNDTITNICKNIGIGRSTVRDRFKKIGYEYNDKIKQYESIIEIVEDNASFNEICMTIEPISESSKNVVTNKKQNSSNLVVGTDVVNNKVLEELILNYSDMNNKLNEVYSWYQESSNSVVIEDKKLVIDDFEGDLVSRSFKLYEPIQKEFADFCKVNNRYKVQDILCQFIKEGLEKYK